MCAYVIASPMCVDLLGDWIRVSYSQPPGCAGHHGHGWLVERREPLARNLWASARFVVSRRFPVVSTHTRTHVHIFISRCDCDEFIVAFLLFYRSTNNNSSNKNEFRDVYLNMRAVSAQHAWFMGNIRACIVPRAYNNVYFDAIARYLSDLRLASSLVRCVPPEHTMFVMCVCVVAMLLNVFGVRCSYMMRRICMGHFRLLESEAYMRTPPTNFGS